MSDANKELSLTRLIKAAPEKVYAAWTQPELLKQWFAPKPFTTPEAVMDVRVGGSNKIVMQDADGNLYPNHGVYLEVVPNQKIVVTDAYTSAWVPSEKAFITITVTFEPEAGGTRYTAHVGHWSEADREAHEKMGFHEGWGQCTDQLAALVESN